MIANKQTNKQIFSCAVQSSATAYHHIYTLSTTQDNTTTPLGCIEENCETDDVSRPEI